MLHILGGCYAWYFAYSRIRVLRVVAITITKGLGQERSLDLFGGDRGCLRLFSPVPVGGGAVAGVHAAAPGFASCIVVVKLTPTFLKSTFFLIKTCSLKVLVRNTKPPRRGLQEQCTELFAQNHKLRSETSFSTLSNFERID